MSKSLFSVSPRPLIIGMVHLGPLAGRAGSPGYAALLKKARADLAILKAGGVNAIMFENMYDQPHSERLDEPRYREFSALLGALTPGLHKPWGISLLWNDYPHAFALAKRYGGSWIRVPVFVDSVSTAYGKFFAHPKDVVEARTKARATKVAIMADVHVKHATMLKPRPITVSARATVAAGADALIITGKWTGDPPEISDITRVRQAVGSVPIFTGSGLTAENARRYVGHLDGAIVGTAFKRGGASPKSKYLMRSPWTRPLAVSRIRAFMQAVAKSRPV